MFSCIKLYRYFKFSFNLRGLRAIRDVSGLESFRVSFAPLKEVWSFGLLSFGGFQNGFGVHCEVLDASHVLQSEDPEIFTRTFSLKCSMALCARTMFMLRRALSSMERYGEGRQHCLLR